MPLTHFPHGLTSFGIPVIGSGGALVPITTGTYFWVHSGTGSSGNTGLSPSEPLALIDQAINKCTDNKGDVIIVMPGHSENISGSSSLVPDIAGITIVGLGSGTNVPQLTFTATGSIITITGAGTTLKNLHFIAGISAVANAINIDADYVTLENCKTTFSSTGYDFLIHVNIDAYDYAKILGCEFDAENATAGSNDGIRLDDTHNTRIIGNYFNGDFARAAIIGEGAAGKSLLLRENWIYNDDTAAASNGIDLNVAFTGLITDNRIGTLRGASSVNGLLDPGSCLCMRNYAVNAIDEKGIELPTTAST